MLLFATITALSLAATNAGDILKPLFRWTYGRTSTERLLLTQKAELKHEQSKYSMSEHFAKYCKLQRRINAIEQQLSELHGQRLQSNLIVSMLCTYALRFFFGLVLVYLGFRYRNTPLLHVNTNIDLSPFTYIIAYPNDEYNSVSVPFWIMCCTTVGGLIKAGGQ